jgi:small neutral amino acid transporter SnatA (MarC family)
MSIFFVVLQWALLLLLNPLTLLIGVVLAVRHLKRTRDPQQPLSVGDQRRRTVALGLLIFLVAGFGLCGGFGTYAGVASYFGSSSGEARAYGILFLVPGLVGLALAAVGLWLLRKYRRPES